LAATTLNGTAFCQVERTHRLPERSYAPEGVAEAGENRHKKSLKKNKRKKLKKNQQNHRRSYADFTQLGTADKKKTKRETAMGGFPNTPQLVHKFLYNIFIKIPKIQ